MSQDDPRTDDVLIAAANRGDEAAFCALYFRYRDWAVRLARRFTGNDDDALDVLQETFAYFFRKFPGFHLTASMTTFLYPVIRNLSIALRRKRGRLVLNEEVLDAAPAPAAIGVDDPRQELAAVMAMLSAAQRQVVLMRFVDGMSLEEIALALSIPTGTVKSRLHNALQILREDAGTRRYFDPI